VSSTPTRPLLPGEHACVYPHAHRALGLCRVADAVVVGLLLALSLSSAFSMRGVAFRVCVKSTDSPALLSAHHIPSLTVCCRTTPATQHPTSPIPAAKPAFGGGAAAGGGVFAAKPGGAAAGGAFGGGGAFAAKPAGGVFGSKTGAFAATGVGGQATSREEVAKMYLLASDAPSEDDAYVPPPVRLSLYLFIYLSLSHLVSASKFLSPARCLLIVATPHPRHYPRHRIRSLSWCVCAD